MTWNIRLSPVRTDAPWRYEVAGDILYAWLASQPWEDVEPRPGDAEAFDLSPLPEGGILPRAAVGEGDDPPLWLLSPVERVGGVLHATLLLGVAPGAPEAATFPEPVGAVADGLVPLPWAGFLPPPPPPAAPEEEPQP